MKNVIRWSTGLMLALVISVPMVSAQHQQGHQRMMTPRVPADKLAEARALTSPLSPSSDIVEQGKAIYEGKGTCINCHGARGRGDGPGAATLDPPPRVFKSRGFWKHRTEGEIFWVIKHGSAGTAMIPFGGMLTDEEIWTVMQYEQSFAGGHGRQGGQHGMSGMKGSKGKGGHEGEGHGKKAGSGCQGKQQGQSGHGSGGSKHGHGDKGCKKGGKGHHGSHHKDPLKQAEQAASAAITIQQAITATTEQVPGTVIEAEFETKEANAFWEVTVASNDGKVLEVHIDSESGKVLSSEEKHYEKKGRQKRMRKRKGKMGEHDDDHGCCSKGKGDKHDGQHQEH